MTSSFARLVPAVALVLSLGVGAHLGEAHAQSNQVQPAQVQTNPAPNAAAPALTSKKAMEAGQAETSKKQVKKSMHHQSAKKPVDTVATHSTAKSAAPSTIAPATLAPATTPKS